MRRTPTIAAAVMVGGLVTGLLMAPAGAQNPQPARPNVVVIMTDDMRADELDYMPHTTRLLGQLDLTDFVSNHPLCCPARAELLTGQYGHHNGVHHNVGPMGTYAALIDKDNTLGTWFDDAGYETSVVGKFMNGWDPEQGTLRQRGWDNLDVIYGPWDYHPYWYHVYQESGPPIAPGVHINDFVATQTVKRVTEAAAEGRPFFVWSSYVAPHGMMDDQGKWRGEPVPAPRHAGMFDRMRPAFQQSPSYVPVPRKKVREAWRNRIRSLQSVDEGVRDVVAAAQTAGVHENTVYVFTSDNGYLMGEHGEWGKNLPYEESLRVPLLAAGPGVASGASSKGASMVDIAPSLAALAGVTPGRPQDGRANLFSLTGGWNRVLIQGGNNNTAKAWRWRGVREDKWVHWQYVGGREFLFNRKRDPYQLFNLSGQRPRVERRLAQHVPPLG